MYSEPVTLTGRLMKQVQKNIVSQTNVALYKHIKTKRHPKLEQQNRAFLPSGETQRFTSTPHRATDRTTDIFDCRHETMKRADRLHITIFIYDKLVGKYK